MVEWKSSAHLLSLMDGKLDDVVSSSSLLIVSIMAHGRLGSLVGSDESSLPISDVLKFLTDRLPEEIPLVSGTPLDFLFVEFSTARCIILLLILFDKYTEPNSYCILITPDWQLLPHCKLILHSSNPSFNLGIHTRIPMLSWFEISFSMIF